MLFPRNFVSTSKTRFLLHCFRVICGNYRLFFFVAQFRIGALIRISWDNYNTDINDSATLWTALIFYSDFEWNTSGNRTRYLSTDILTVHTHTLVYETNNWKLFEVPIRYTHDVINSVISLIRLIQSNKALGTENAFSCQCALSVYWKISFKYIIMPTKPIKKIITFAAYASRFKRYCRNLRIEIKSICVIHLIILLFIYISA